MICSFNIVNGIWNSCIGNIGMVWGDVIIYRRILGIR